MPKLDYSRNQILALTAGSYVKTDIVSGKTLRTILSEAVSDPDLLPIGNGLEPSTTDYHIEYLAFSLAEKLAVGATRRMEGFMKGIPAILEKVERKVLDVHEKDTDEYKQIFPKSRSHLYEGETYHDKFLNLETLSSLIGLSTGCVAIKVYLDAYLDPFRIAITNAEKAHTHLTSASEKVEAARKFWCDEVLGAIGLLMFKFRHNPEKIDKFVDLSIFDTPQSHIDPDKGTATTSLPTLKITCINMVFDPAKSYYLHNSGPTALKIGSADASTTNPIPNPKYLGLDETIIAAGTELGAPGNRNLLVENQDEFLYGEIKIKEVPPEE